MRGRKALHHRCVNESCSTSATCWLVNQVHRRIPPMRFSAIIFLFFAAIALSAQSIVVEHSVPAFRIVDQGGPITIPFQGPRGEESAIVESKNGMIRVSAEFKHLPPPSSFGSEYLAYVMWAISPDRAPVNLGELARDGERAKIDVVRKRGSFGLVVTAERDPDVEQPAGEVVLESGVPPGIETVPARYELLPAGAAPGESAVERGNEKRKGLDDERAIALARDTAARTAAETARNDVNTTDRERAEEEADTAGAERSVAEALAAVEQSKLEQLGAGEVEPWSPSQMLAELSKILETRAIGQDLVINASSLFQDDRYWLKEDPAEKSFMEIAGILRGHPGLEFEVYAHIAGTGSAESDQRLSDNLANAVRDYLVGQGLDRRSIAASDFAAAALGGDEDTDEKKSLKIVISEAQGAAPRFP
jgi:outer membrane protein OmpA-like peptidoglycan-associated protein